MSRPVALDRAAYEDLLATLEWHDVHAREGTSERLSAAVHQLLVELGEDRAASRWFSRRLGVRTAFVEGFPYQILYVDDAVELRVLAVAHLRRRPGYWRSRIGAK